MIMCCLMMMSGTLDDERDALIAAGYGPYIS